MYAPKSYKRNGSYRAFNFETKLYENDHVKNFPKKSFNKKVAFSNSKNVQYYNKYHPSKDVSNFSSHPIKTGNRYEALTDCGDDNHGYGGSKNIVNPPTDNRKGFTSKSNKQKYRNLIRKRPHTEEEKQIIKYAIEKGPLNIESNRNIKCVNVTDVLNAYEQNNVTHLPKAGKIPFLDGKILNHAHKTLPIQLMLDTGSSISLISKKITDQLHKYGFYTTEANCKLISASPQKTKITEAITLSIEIPHNNQSVTLTHTFLVCNDLPFEALIGNDSLEKVLHRLDYSRRCAELKENSEHCRSTIVTIPFGHNLKNLRSETYSYSCPTVLLYG